MKRLSLNFVCGLACCAWLSRGPTTFAVDFEWARQFSTSNPNSFNQGVAADGLGSVYVAGGAVFATAPPSPAHLAKYDALGNLAWLTEFGDIAEATAVAADGLGSAYVAGITKASLDGTYLGGADAFLRKYDAAGSLVWGRQIATTDDDRGWAVSADGNGNVYIAGSTWGEIDGGGLSEYQDAFVAKYDGLGNRLWVRQFGSWITTARGVSLDGLGSVYVSGATQGDLDGVNAGFTDAFVTKFDAAGNVLWTRQLGTSQGDGNTGYSDPRSDVRVSADGLGGVYIAGPTDGSLGGPNIGGTDVFVAKYDTLGSLLWTRQLGTAINDFGAGISADGFGNVYVSGTSNSDPFVSKYDGAGNLVWTQQLASVGAESNVTISADGLGGVYIAGRTLATNLGGPGTGQGQAFLAKFSDPVPEPSTIILVGLALAPIVSLSRRRPRSQFATLKLFGAVLEQ